MRRGAYVSMPITTPYILDKAYTAIVITSPLGFDRAVVMSKGLHVAYCCAVTLRQARFVTA